MWRWLAAVALTVELGLAACSQPSDSTDLSEGAPPVLETETAPEDAKPAPPPVVEASTPAALPGDGFTGPDPENVTIPPGSTFYPIEAATVVYLTMLHKDWNALMDTRKALDVEIAELDALREVGELSLEQEGRRRDIVNRMGSMDNFFMQIEYELKPTAAFDRVARYLDTGVWSIDYQGEGLWHINTGTGPWVFDEDRRDVRPLEEGGETEQGPGPS